MKGVIMAFWYLPVTVGNLWVLLDQRRACATKR